MRKGKNPVDWEGFMKYRQADFPNEKNNKIK